MMGKRNSEVVIRACCWVRLTVEMSRPADRQDSR
jgi:hypothetical protein